MTQKVVSRLKPTTRPRHFVKEWRKHRGYTQEQLAEMADVTHGTISQLERGLINYTQPLLEKLAEALVTDPGSLVMRDPTQGDESLWSLWDQAKEGERRQLLDMARVIVKKAG